ncbi:HEPN domain-containing protein [Candidatus Saganbacteria bacterium]|nr:HEPN domain-containing protein [Candidatus Saganbacteria bacterium]
MDEKLKPQINAMMQKSEEALKDASVLFDLGSYGAAASRAYYAVFHMLQAVLLVKNLSFSKHSGVIGGFSRHFIKEGLFPREYAGKIKNLWKNREIGDYEYETKISSKDARESIEEANLIVNSLKKYIESKF